MITVDDWKPINADVELLKKCKKAIRQVVPDADVILYGSRARGDANAYSDYDILVLTSGPANIPVHKKMIENISPLELDGAVLTLAIYNRQQWDTPLYRAMPFHENIDHDGVVL
ncbi:MAG: nucleotidyltransferase domain-containing protein [Sedimentisphaerales bacterium]